MTHFNRRSFLTLAASEPETLKTLLTPSPFMAEARGVGVRQALIWQLRDFGEHHVAAHTGGDPGTSTVAAVDLDRQTAVLAFANASVNSEIRAFLTEVLIRLLERARKA
jgi:hypothetical protein